MTDRDALTELHQHADSDAIHEVEHYLYLPNSKVAKKVAKELSRKGFSTTTRLGALGDSWLLLAKMAVVTDEVTIAAHRRVMEAYAAKFDGEYDGWEAATKSDGLLQ